MRRTTRTEWQTPAAADNELLQLVDTKSLGAIRLNGRHATKYTPSSPRRIDLGNKRVDLGKVNSVHLGKTSRNRFNFGTRPWENPTLGKGFVPWETCET